MVVNATMTPTRYVLGDPNSGFDAGTAAPGDVPEGRLCVRCETVINGREWPRAQGVRA